MPDVNSVNTTDELTVGQLIDILKGLPQSYPLAFQVGDSVDSQVIRPASIELDNLWGIVDIIFEEWNKEWRL